MKKIITIIVFSMIILGLTGCNDNNEKKTGEDTEYAQTLYEKKNPYIGDAAATMELLGALNIGEELGSYTIELETEEQPYRLNVVFKDIVDDRDKFMSKASDKGVLVLALIGNLDSVWFSYPDEEGKGKNNVTVYVDKGNEGRNLDKDIKEYGESAEGIQELLDIIGYGTESEE